jgi:hypothetical protein
MRAGEFLDDERRRFVAHGEILENRHARLCAHACILLLAGLRRPWVSERIRLARVL